MDDCHKLDEDYVRRLKKAQESGDTSKVPLVDESRVVYVKGGFVSVAEVVRTLRKRLKRCK